MNDSPGQNSKLILAAMIFAVAMTFIDQTIVAIAIPTIQKDLSLSTTGVQWIINGYLLSLSALFAFGGRLADTDALNRVPRSRYGEATGITQTVRNFGSSLGLAVLGSILILENRSNLESTAAANGVPKHAADEIADAISQGGGGGDGGRLRRLPGLDAGWEGGRRDARRGTQRLVRACAIAGVLRRGSPETTQN